MGQRNGKSSRMLGRAVEDDYYLAFVREFHSSAFRIRKSHTKDFAEDVDPTATGTRTGRYRPADNASTSTSKGGIRAHSKWRGPQASVQGSAGLG